MHIKKPLLFVLFAAFISLAGAFTWSKLAGKVTQKELTLISLKPLPSLMNSDYDHARVVGLSEPDAVSEKIAQSLISQLKRKGKAGQEFADGLALCSAKHAFEVRPSASMCKNEDDGSLWECLVKRGVGRRVVGQSLMADRFDLNDDGIPDYIITDRSYCGYINANQAQVYFVMLSMAKDDFRLAYADWTSNSIRVVIDPDSGKKVLIEGMAKASGIYSIVFTYINGQYISGRCIVENVQGVDYCDK